VVALTHELAITLGPKVRVNCISPAGSTRAGMARQGSDHAQHPAGRVGRVETSAAAVAYPAVGGGGLHHGAELVVDGGMTRKMIYT
jgi:NAD(P)-dependent dehydrogenase (short-subunit alcohol dehydrogenase family)